MWVWTPARFSLAANVKTGKLKPRVWDGSQSVEKENQNQTRKKMTQTNSVNLEYEKPTWKPCEIIKEKMQYIVWDSLGKDQLNSNIYVTDIM